MLRRSATSGYTLLELLVVLAVAGFIMAGIASYSTQSMPGTKLKSAAQRLADTLRTAQAMAITDGTPVTVAISHSTATYLVEPGGEATTLPPGTSLSFTPNSFLPIKVPGIRFFPDGSAAGGVIEFTAGGRSFHIAVDWLTSRVTLNE